VEAEAKRIRQFSRKAGASALMVPDTIVKVEEIPVLGSGKTDYAVARQMAVERLGLDAAA
jgi:acyl-[acyl-carrier-protein]-phospholipid O-acyltransferase/long-chain-fatty-acid--[acyl-carrier-protein] ligase